MAAVGYSADAKLALSGADWLFVVMRRYTRRIAQARGAAIKIPPVFPVPKLAVDPEQWVNGAVNLLLNRQPAAKSLLAAHSGRTFHVDLGQARLALTIGHDGTLSVADRAVVADVMIRIDLMRLLRSGWLPGQPFPEVPGMLHVSGDAAMAQSLSTLARHWRPDLEDLLSEWMGDVAAVQVLRGAKSLARGLFDAGEKISQNFAEYLSYETNQLAARPAMQSLGDDVRKHVDRLRYLDSHVQEIAVRIARLESDARGAS